MVRTRADLAARVAAWPEHNRQTPTWALVFVGEIPSASALAAARHAAKICDRVAAVVCPVDPVAGARIGPNFATLIRSAGVDLVWAPAPEKTPQLSVTLGGTDVAGVDGRLILQGLLAVLPLVVVAHAAELPLVRALRVVQSELGDVAVVRIVR